MEIRTQAMRFAQTRWSGALIGAATLLAGIATMELFFRSTSPLPDPYESAKTRRELNQYIRSEFPRNYLIRTRAEEGLPGVSGQNTFSTNNMGFRGDDLRMPKPGREYRIFLIGGSTTECFYLDDAQALHRVLQDELHRQTPNGEIRVYNAGKSGDGLPDHISMLVHRIAHLAPDLITVFAGVNDLTRAIYNYDYLHYVEERGHKLSFFRMLDSAATEFQIGRRLHSVIGRMAPQQPAPVLEQITQHSNYREKVQLRKSVAVSDRRPRVDLEAYRVNLTTLAGVLRAHGIQTVFMTQPSTWGSDDDVIKEWQWMLYRFGVTYRESFMDEALESLNHIMREIAARYDVPLLDLAKEMPKTSAYFYDDVHFNVQGARYAGVALARLLTAKSLIQFPARKIRIEAEIRAAQKAYS